MSDLYIVLRSRLEALPEWVFIDAAVLRTARERKGLSYETMARAIPVSAKTWERYEKAGRVPRHMVARIAAPLGLEIEEPEPQRVTARVPRSDRDLGEALNAMDAKLDLIIAALAPSKDLRARVAA